MLVYGDHDEIADPKELLAKLAQRIGRLAQMTPGIERHAALVGILIRTGQLLQGLADAVFAEGGEDKRSEATDELGDCVLQLAKAVCQSWDSGFGKNGPLPAAAIPEQLPSEVQLRTPEGFAFYAVYPEPYIEAARRLSLIAPPRVIGIRSIGTALAAIVAAALEAPAPLTVRPYGDPFARRIAIAPEVERELLSGDAHYVIVDEGPGLSGSSFGAVADWLQERGVPLGRIAFLPSHAAGPGLRASDKHRRRWALTQRMPALFDDWPRLLSDWVSPLIGEFDEPVADISGGEWRRRRYSSEGQLPAVNPAWERRKFLASAGGERFLIKFAGLGSIGERKVGIARALHSACLTPEPIGLVHGFLVERWNDDAQPLAHGDKPITQIARYIGARARLFPTAPHRGASLIELHEMCRRNVSLALGSDFVGLAEQREPRLDQLARRVVPVRTDNRLLPHEWIRSSGRLLKTDALDHHAGHDLIGCQDMAWDVAGAIVEFELDAGQSTELIASAERPSSRHVDRELLEFYRLAYLSFRLGQATLSADGCLSDSGENGRLREEADRYRHELEQLLQESRSPATRRESLIG
jgi:hypothetical protein